MIQKLKRIAAKNISNISGWSTQRKIVVFLSDDWGSIRVPKKAQSSLKDKGFNFSYNPFNKYDGLANACELTALFEVLTSVKDSKGNHAHWTAVSVVGNPDFEVIEQNEFQKYVVEPFNKTLDRYYPNQDIMKLWHQGIQERIFTPQFHGREHFNAGMWLRGLQAKDPVLHTLFKHKAIGPITPYYQHLSSNYMAAYDGDVHTHEDEWKTMTKDGVQMFRELFGFKPKLFTATSLLHQPEFEKVLQAMGFDFIDKAKKNKNVLGKGQYTFSNHKLGEKNPYGQLYLTRNCMFEPSQAGVRDWVTQCMEDIAYSFRWNKPAIISSHRMNYIDSVIQGNGKNGRLMLKMLLQEMMQKWPDIEFMEASELGDLIKKDSNESY